MSTANHWLRLWHDMPNDPKWRTIARVSGQPISAVLAVYLHLMVDASRNVTRGHATVTAEDVASAIDVTEDVVHAILAAMQTRVLSGMQLLGWEKRQPKREDSGNETTGAKSAAQRKKEQRERERAALDPLRDGGDGHDESRDVTGGHAREEKSREEKTNTVPDGTGGQPPLDPAALTKSELWKAGKSLLREQGMALAQCGTFIGKLVKDHGEAAVLEAVQVAIVNRPADAGTYLVGVLREKTKPTKSTQADRRADTLAGLTGNSTGATDAKHRGDAIDVQARVVPGNPPGTQGMGGAGLLPPGGADGGQGG